MNESRAYQIYKELSELFVEKGIASNKFGLLAELYRMAERPKITMKTLAGIEDPEAEIRELVELFCYYADKCRGLLKQRPEDLAVIHKWEEWKERMK